MRLNRNEVLAECGRIEEDSEYSAKGHFNAGARWHAVHLWIGIPTAIVAAVAGVSAFKEFTEVAGSLSILVAALTAVSTFLNPSGRFTAHHAAGNQYLALRNQTRVFRTVELSDEMDDEEVRARIVELAQRRDDLNAGSPAVPRWAFEKARAGIELGEASYRVDNR